MTYQYIDLTYLNTISSGDKNLSKTLLQMVQTELGAAFPTMNDAYQTRNWEDFHEISHKLKATLAFVGNPQLSQTNQEILAHLEEKKHQVDYSNWLDQFKQLSPQILSEIGLALDQL